MRVIIIHEGFAHSADPITLCVLACSSSLLARAPQIHPGSALDHCRVLDRECTVKSFE